MTQTLPERLDEPWLRERRAGPPRVDSLGVLDVARVALGSGGFTVSDEVRARLAVARAVVDDVVTRGVPAYGVTRGLGPLRDQEIPPHRQAEFQTWTLLTHAAGVGEPMTRAEARSTLAARLAGMAQGGSGISPAAFDALHDLLLRDVTPWLPADGSVGAADLAQLAAAGLVVVGRGRVLAGDGRTGLPAAPALAAAGLAPVELGPKDALAIIGANAASVGLACLAVHRLTTLQPAADLAAAAALETLGGNPDAWSAPVVAARAHPGQQVSGDRLRLALRGGDLAAGGVPPTSLQDAVSVRTVPQVHGVLVEGVATLEDTLRIELTSAADNPLIDEGGITSNGNFSALRLAVATESLRLVLAHVGMMSERRTSLMIGRERLGIPLADQLAAAHDDTPPLAMTLSNTAAALRASLQQLASPVSVFGVPVADGVEDHTAQAYVAVRLLERSIATAELLLGIETLVAARVVLRRRGLVAPRVHALLDEVRAACDLPDATVDERAEVARLTLLRHGSALRDETDGRAIPETAPAEFSVDGKGLLVHDAP